ncbi:unknown protein [Microcystis aeruginosa NIES-843]|uniref:Uncharacterized protein n=1 Tax=Microcystis aeruginosa (strain NIES-843 / IAM M-2473) TaxID=449447 RepID=B0JKX9_MICAN|nr:unknown protein [Microcystis aeruginosa NIES-843]
MELDLKVTPVKKVCGFQSLIGFKINWNEGNYPLISNKKLFQSLIGFKINWNNNFIFKRSLLMAFQSLIGFKINWNVCREETHQKAKEVSIPNRV